MSFKRALKLSHASFPKKFKGTDWWRDRIYPKALMEVALVIVIVAIMIGMTQDLGNVLTIMMVRPLATWWMNKLLCFFQIRDTVSVDAKIVVFKILESSTLLCLASWSWLSQNHTKVVFRILTHHRGWGKNVWNLATAGPTFDGYLCYGGWWGWGRWNQGLWIRNHRIMAEQGVNLWPLGSSWHVLGFEAEKNGGQSRKPFSFSPQF